ncbi:uncharacterized protein N7477_006456, partial [Penicillium maclennaniae]|uniref:uncharacterized protein n=1 Tax=Penicillium maclennaniae TaxID=1343394 RepID=UPI00254195B9
LLRDCQLEILSLTPDETLDTPEVDIPAAPQAGTGINVPVRRSGRTHHPSRYYQSSSSSSSGSYGGIRPVFASAITAASAQEGVVFQKVKDEQIVHEGVMSLLRALTITIVDVRCRWTSHPNPFSSVELGPEGRSKKLTALTDGYLEGISGPKRIYALVEAKAAIRHRIARPEVLWQEAAEIIAWIMTDPLGSYPECLKDMIPDDKDAGRGSCRMLISQDHKEIFMTIASYSATYTQYLQGTKGQHADFLTLYEYGPWRIQSRTHMEHFARLVVGFCMAISDDDKNNLDIQMHDA